MLRVCVTLCWLCWAAGLLPPVPVTALPVAFLVSVPASALIPVPVSVARAAMALAILSLLPQPPEGVLVSPRLSVAFTLPALVCIPLLAPVAVPSAAGLVPCAMAAGFLTGALPAAL